MVSIQFGVGAHRRAPLLQLLLSAQFRIGKLKDNTLEKLAFSCQLSAFSFLEVGNSVSQESIGGARRSSGALAETKNEKGWLNPLI